MANLENDGFARVVLGEGFCTREQIERCLNIQSNTRESLSLGQSLLREGYITQEQYSRILDLLRRGYKKDRDVVVARKAEQRAAEDRTSALQGQEDRVLGGLAVSEGWITAEALKSCMDGDGTGAVGRTLADTLVARGYLGRAQVDSLRARLVRRDLTCPSCKAPLSVLGLSSSKPLHCPRCRGPLAP
jgi:hypothetical protein